MIVYVIFDSVGNMYVGLTKDFDKRLVRHNTGRCIATKQSKGTWELLHFWTIPGYMLASKLERYLHKLEDTEIMDIVSCHPAFDSYLLSRATKLKTTPYELKRHLAELRSIT